MVDSTTNTKQCQGCWRLTPRRCTHKLLIMPGRIIPLVNGELYHIYNRGTDRKDIFLQPRDYKRFQNTFYYYHFSNTKVRFSKFVKSELEILKIDAPKLVEIICYCLMPNHFHFLLKQVSANGISVFISKLSNSYTKYFNLKYTRVGPLLQGAFKSVLVETDEQLLHLSRYIHLNPIVSGLHKDLETYKWSSYSEYVAGNSGVCFRDTILGHFSLNQSYAEFVKDQISYGTSLEILKHKTIDVDD